MKKLGERPPQLSDVRIIHPDFLRYLYEMYLEKDVPMPTKALTTIVLSLHECDYIRIHGPVVNAESVQYYTEVNSRVGQLLKSDLMEEKLLEYMEREKLLLICVCITGYSPPKPLRTVSLSGTKAVVTPLAVHHASEPFPHTSTTCQLSQFHVPSMISAQHDEAPEAAVPVAGVSSLAYEGAIVDQCIKNVLSLPEEVGEVALKHKCLTAEINKQQSLLNKAKEVLLACKLQKECIQEEIGKVNRKVCLTQGKAALKSKSCIELENGVYTLVSDNLAVNQKMKAIQDEWKKELKVYVEYREKMGKHMHAVADIEASYRINIAVTTKLKQVELLRKQLQELKTNSEHTEKMLTGESERILQSEINALKAKEIRVNKEIVQKKEKLKVTQDREAKIKQDIDILQKRNQAQLTRLKRQVKEAQVRNKQWNEEACELETSIAELRNHIKE
ncbi:coiled-coil domain-containing protein 122-like [Saccoglossus kowalevskii]